MPRLMGPNNSILHLILMKSGAHVDIESPTILATGGQEMIKINVVGPPNLVTLVGQMIQEVAKLFLFSSADLLPPSGVDQRSGQTRIAPRHSARGSWI